MQCNATIQAVHVYTFFFISWLIQNQKKMFLRQNFTAVWVYTANLCTSETSAPHLLNNSQVFTVWLQYWPTLALSMLLDALLIGYNNVLWSVSKFGCQSACQNIVALCVTHVVIQVENEHSSIVYCTHLVLVRMGTQIHHLLAKIPTSAPQCMSKDGVTTSVLD